MDNVGNSHDMPMGEEPENQQKQDMPTGSMSREARSYEMPNGNSSTLSAGGDMPNGGPTKQHSSRDMPSGMMESEKKSDSMPTGDMGETASENLMEADDGLDRFGPISDSPETSMSDTFEPGMVEVEFRDGVQPQLSSLPTGRSGMIASPSAGTLSNLNQKLQDYGLLHAEPSIQMSEQDAMTAQAFARGQDSNIPNLSSFITLHFPDTANTENIARELSQLPEIERAVAVPRAIPPLSPLNEPLVGTSDQVAVNPVTGHENQWYIFRCRANQAWDVASGKNVVIADIDWGYRTTHQDLSSRLDLNRAYNSYDGGTNVSTGPSVSHGTAVMGIAGGADNNLGMAGFAFNSTLWPVQADSGPGPSLGGNAWARGIDWVRTANSNGRRKVIILEVQTSTFGNYEMVPSVNAAIRTAIAHGVVVCVAAGNGNRDAGVDDSGNPIPATGSILVGATEYHPTENRRAGFSNFGNRVVVCAPGDSSHDVTASSSSDTAVRNGFGGTSGATPKVAGTAALLLEANPNLTHAEIRTILRNTGTAVVTDPNKPIGTFLNAEAAVRQAARPMPSGPVVSWGANRLDAFVIGTNSALYHKWWNGSAWGPSVTGYENMGGTITSNPEAVAWGPNRLDVFVLGTNSALYHKWWNGSAWGPSVTGYENMGGTIIGQPKAVAWGPNRLDVFVLGTNSALYHKWWNGSAWGPSVTGYEYMGGTLSSSPEVVAWGPNRLDVFAIGTNKRLYHKWWNGSAWGPSLTGWEDLGGTIIGQPRVVSWGPNRLDIFARGTNSRLYHKWWNGSAWGPSVTGWENLGGTIIRM
ncbi:MAG: S8 family serine peptidase [Nitrospira sp.]|nr:S8 family serine peptidase [Nitrospira sp.]